MRYWSRLVLILASTWMITAHAGDYFLEGSQKQELLLYGHMTGHDGALYDIWIVPGYVPPARNVRKGWQQAGGELKAYGQATHYRSLAKASRAWTRTAGNDLLLDFALKGTGTAWADAMGAASERVDQRVFGWWFAYPWALIEATTETVVRTGVGIPSSIGVALGAYSVVPAWYFASPAVKSVGYAAIPGTVLPVVAASWNTVIAPPLALTGQQPAPERADGFWMKRLKDPTEDDLRGRVVAWQSRWKDDPVLTAQRDALAASAKLHAEKVAALRVLIEAEETARQQETKNFEAERRRLVAEKTLTEAAALREELSAQGYTSARLRAQRPMLLDLLLDQGMTHKEANQMLNVLMEKDGSVPGRHRSDDEKTDPLLQIRDRL